VAAVKFDAILSQTVQKIKDLKRAVELSEESHMKYIILFEGMSWSE